MELTCLLDLNTLFHQDRPHIQAQTASPINRKSKKRRTQTVNSLRVRNWLTADSVPAPAWTTGMLLPSQLWTSSSLAMDKLVVSSRSGLMAKSGPDSSGLPA